MGSVKKISLWRAGLQSFGRHWREWLPVAMVFFFIFALFNISMMKFIEPLQAKMMELKGSKDPQAGLALFKDMAPQLSVFAVAMILIMYVEHYLFLWFFMKREQLAITAKPTLRQFFCYVAVSMQLGFALILPIGALMGVSALFMKAVPALFVIGGIGSFVLAIFLMIRLYFAIPLAAAKLLTPLRSSWTLTKGNVWRLLGNTLLFMLLIVVIYLGALIVSILAGLALGLVATLASLPVKPLIDIFFRVVLGSAFSVFIAGMSSSYASAACRILYQEKLQADPTFILTR